MIRITAVTLNGTKVAEEVRRVDVEDMFKDKVNGVPVLNLHFDDETYIIPLTSIDHVKLTEV